jgi:type III restriction enzyme
MRLKFEGNLQFQTDAVEAITDLFEGFSQDATDFSLTSEIVPNIAPSSFLDWDEVFNNYMEVYQQNGIKSDYRPMQLEMDSGQSLAVPNAGFSEYPSFTVEMETGTGKTYVYLKTLYKLYQEYNFTKFIIVVPSRAIYEGVVKMFDTAKGHFESAFGSPNAYLQQYDGKPEETRSFAEATSLRILLITLDSFNKKTNKLFKETEGLSGSGKYPYEFLAGTRPILILDEPQNMTSEISKQAIRTLSPLFALHYSATHRELLNQVYRLTPFDAYKDGLVKKIQVYGFQEEQQLSFKGLELIQIDKTRKRAVFKGYKENKGFLQFVNSITLKTNDEVFQKTGNSHHRGLVLSDINHGEGFVEFDNGECLYLAGKVERSKADLFRAQIRETIRTHFRRQEQLKEKEIKVLSLIFIDRVANYQEDDGIIRKIFEDEFERMKPASPFFASLNASQVHSGYFAKKKNKKTGEDIFFDVFTKKEQKDAEKEAYQLIMRDKERMLSFYDGKDELKKVCFIFAHSALKEGWDNPNVFQICTLSNTVSEIKKRQEIGRGLRLPVNQDGTRLKDLEENILTVVANESYESYVSGLQQEYEEAGELDRVRVGNAAKEPAKRNKVVFDHREFQNFWDKLVKRIHYKIEINTDELVAQAVRHINDNVIFPEPRLVKQHGQFGINQVTVMLKGFSEEEKPRAKLEVSVEDTTQRELIQRSYKVKIPRGIPFSHYISNALFKAFLIEELDTEQGCIVLSDGRRIYKGNAEVYQFASHSKENSNPVQLEDLNLPVPNFLEKISMELGLTRRTILRIFQGIHEVKRRVITKNPEGFINEFLKALKTKYADHLANHVTFYTHDEFSAAEPMLAYTSGEMESTTMEYLAELFPDEKPFVGTELIDGDNRFIYDRVQIDSEIEETFIKEQVSLDPNVVLYFKFPSKFKLRLPSVIGNYNPDWGIVRKDQDGARTLHLVRETKGREDVRKLRFEHEKRKIICARKYFKTLGIDYRPISATTTSWRDRE